MINSIENNKDSLIKIKLELLNLEITLEQAKKIYYELKDIFEKFEFEKTKQYTKPINELFFKNNSFENLDNMSNNISDDTIDLTKMSYN